jgi:hypothetical protein
LDRGQDKHQITSTKSQKNSNVQNSKGIRFGHLKLVLGNYLGFVIWNLRRSD